MRGDDRIIEELLEAAERWTDAKLAVAGQVDERVVETANAGLIDAVKAWRRSRE
jgi:hypothetical protein